MNRPYTLRVKRVSFVILATLAALSWLAMESPDKMGVINIAICQIFSLDGDRSGNHARIEHAVEEAKAAGADIACFPECVLLGWVNPEAHKRAHPIPGADTDRLCKLAKKHEIHLCLGLAEKEGELLYDSAVLIDDKGKILLKHRKINILTELMDPPYALGGSVKTADTTFGKIGLLICADTFKTEILDRMKALRPDLVLVPYGWAADEDRWPEHGKELSKVVSRAAQVIGAPLVGTDVVGEILHGPWTGLVYGGQSAAADEEGKILAIARDRDREIKLIRLTLQN